MDSTATTSPSSSRSDVTSGNAAGTHVRGRGRGGGRNRGRGYDRNRQNTTNNRSKSTFKGHTSEMNGHVFECFNEGTKQGQFTKTLEALGEYMAKNIKIPGVMMCLTENLTAPKVAIPAAFTKDPDKEVLAYALWKEEVADYSKRTGIIKQNMKAIFVVIWGQCSESLKDKVKSLTDYINRLTDGDCVWLLKQIKAIMLQFEGQRSLFLSLADASRNFVNCCQGPEMSLTAYIIEFENSVDAFEHYGGVIGNFPALFDLISVNITDKQERVKAARNQLIGMMFIDRADRRRYGTLSADLENQFAPGNDQYPRDLTEAYGMLVNYKSPFQAKNMNTDQDKPVQSINKSSSDSVSEMTGTTFLGAANAVPGKDGILHATTTCFACNGKGHFSGQCPSNTATEYPITGIQHLQVNSSPSTTENEPNGSDELEFTLLQNKNLPNAIPDTWILLDSQSTVSVFNNPKLLKNIRESTHPLRVATIGGTHMSTLIGDIRNFGTVWYNPASLANILSLAEVRRKCRCVMDTDVEAAIHVYKQDGTVILFKEYENGLYFYDVEEALESKPKTDANAYSFILTVDANKGLFHRREVVK
jgi:hypothetical protein